MFEPKPTYPKLILLLFPYLWLLRHQPKLFIEVIFCGTTFGWHYPWEENRILDRDSFEKLRNET